MEQFSDYSCVSDCPDVEKLLHAHLLPILTPAPGNMLISGDCDSHKRDPMLAIAMEMSSNPNNNTKVYTFSSYCINAAVEYVYTLIDSGIVLVIYYTWNKTLFNVLQECIQVVVIC